MDPDDAAAAGQINAQDAKGSADNDLHFPVSRRMNELPGDLNPNFVFMIASFMGCKTDWIVPAPDVSFQRQGRPSEPGRRIFSMADGDGILRICSW